jgi:hypothetical protein
MIASAAARFVSGSSQKKNHKRLHVLGTSPDGTIASFESMALRSMALLLYAASASAGEPTPARPRPSQTHPPFPLRRTFSLTPAAALEPCSVSAWWWPLIPRQLLGGGGGVGRAGPGGAANFTRDLRGPLPRLLPLRRFLPAPSCAS